MVLLLLLLLLLLLPLLLQQKPPGFVGLRGAIPATGSGPCTLLVPLLLLLVCG